MRYVVYLRILLLYTVVTGYMVEETTTRRQWNFGNFVIIFGVGTYIIIY